MKELIKVFVSDIIQDNEIITKQVFRCSDIWCVAMVSVKRQFAAAGLLGRAVRCHDKY